MKNILTFLLPIIALSLLLVSCETASYYGQAVAGQMYILSHRDDIEELIDDEELTPEFRDKLKTVLAIRTFAEQELLLPLDNNYSTYVDVQRPYVVWNVFASPEFSMEAVNWCYPIAGCVSYRGYFSKEKALEFADGLNRKGYEVYTGGVAAYSTLGWFSDSILNTIIGREDYQLASLIFHELAHQLFYIPGDTDFNESFATAVEQEGLRRWLQYTQENGNHANSIIEAAELDRDRRVEFVALVTQTVNGLKQLYASEQSEQAMRESKQVLLSQLRADYEELKISWGGYDAYDVWFSRGLNNAQLNTVATYFNWVPAFKTMLQEEGNDLATFYASVIGLGELDRVARDEVLGAKAI